MRDLHLTLDQKVGQLFMLGFAGSHPDADAQALLDAIRPGGFLLYQRNIENFEQIYDLTNHLRETSLISPLLAVDHEGGRVDRLKHIFSMMPSTTELAQAGIAHLRAGARIIAAELEATGFNLNFAPVADILRPGSIMAERCLSADPGEVTRLAAAFSEELSRRGILTSAKHFPGLGGAQVDPHFSLPRIDGTKRQLLLEDVLPFVKLFDRVDMLLVSHGNYCALADEKPIPASLSTRVVDGLLRKKLGYRGVTITDDLTMGAITSVGLTPETFLQAFEAGNDLLLFSQATPLVEKGFKTILNAARKSPILRRRVDESVERVLNLKSRIQFEPLRYRTQVKARITRQIEKLRKSLVPVEPRALKV
jgi:beta-N-acetylhexosaminidase